MHISVAIHLKPVDVFLFRQTKHMAHRRKHHYPLFQLIKTELYVIIDHTMITDTAFIHICIAFVIWDVMPQRHLVLRLYRPHIQTRKILTP